jgi:hypothetical protein
MSWSYCERWSKKLAEPMDPLTEDEARARHANGELYTAFSAGDEGAVSVVLEVRLENGFVGIWDLDRCRRPRWRRVLLRHGDRLFMEDGILYDYSDSDKLLTVSQADRILHRHVEPDGTGWQTRRRKGDSTVERAEISLKAGRVLQHYWTPIPEFGEYDAVTVAGIDPGELEQALREYEQNSQG